MNEKVYIIYEFFCRILNSFSFKKMFYKNIWILNLRLYELQLEN